jgi:UDP-N-acetylglucosamine--N-acetylmuramyl-(pentapeptide) pyrophosphoryl-undecaprenol N-acetylglucosamine transferase
MELLGVSVSTVPAGKMRRYANLKWHDRFRHIFVSYIPNFFDMFKLAAGIVKSYFKMLAFKPDVVFVKGGYVGLPVGLAARFYPKRPLVLHDSDASPGLTNRILSKYATKIAVGMPVEFSKYDKLKTEFVGIPVGRDFCPAHVAEKNKLKQKHGVSNADPVVLVIGGSQGAMVLNQAVLAAYPKLGSLAKVFLVAGEANYDDVKATISQRPQDFGGLHILSYVKLAEFMKMSDIAITRAGATTVAELAAIGVASIIIPSPYLASDHQTKNAKVFQKNQAAVVLSEDELDGNKLYDAIYNLVKNKDLRTKLAQNLHKFHIQDAADKMADIIIKVGQDEAQK